MSERLKIYFACSIRGEQQGLDIKRLMMDSMKDLGHQILSEVFASEDQDKSEERALTNQEIYDRDMLWIGEADMIVAALAASYGMGYEVGWFDRGGGRILGLYQGEPNNNFSAMAFGNTRSNFHLRYWQTEEDVKKILEEELGRVPKPED